MKTKKSKKGKVKEAGLKPKESLKFAMSEINKMFGEGSLMRLGDSKRVKSPSLSTGTIGLDMATGIGGIPIGRITEMYGPESGGKTTLALQIVAGCQKQNGTVAYIDSEHALDIDYAKKLGVDIDNLLCSQPETAEETLEIVDRLVKSGAVKLIIVDSVGGMCSRAELEGTMGQSHVGLLARLMSQALRKLASAVHKKGVALIFINQIRMRINMGPYGGNPETTPGGLALRFYASIRMDIRRIGKIEKDENVIGARVRIKVVKNKMSPPFKQTELDLIYGEGFSRDNSLLETALNAGVITLAGSWYKWEDTKLGQGKTSAGENLRKHESAIVEAINKSNDQQNTTGHGEIK